MAVAPTLTTGIGALAGLRPMMTLAVISYAAREGWVRPGRSPLTTIISGHLHKRIAEFAVTEFISNKLPFDRSRMSVASLGSRIAAGAVCGAAIHSSTHLPAEKAAILGGLGAVAGTIIGHQLRARLNREIPDFMVAVIEDALALGGGALIVSVGAALK